MVAKAQVHFADMRVGSDETLPRKLAGLAKAAGIEKIDFRGKFVALKVHFGEQGNLAHVRPQYARTLVDLVKELGGRPFLTDANTLYAGSRRNALDHLDTAYGNGFSPFSAGCHVIIADGLTGVDEVAVPVVGGQYVKEAKIGRAVMDADVVLTLNHFKGHECAGFGGAIKNVGMGCASRTGKMEQHAAGKPEVDAERCAGCRRCLAACGADAVTITREDKALIDPARCVGCGRCVGACPIDAIPPPYDASNDQLCRKIAEYAWAVLRGRPHFHVSLAIDLSPFCDCYPNNDAPFAPDVGLFASFDPVAIDVACADAVNRQPPNPGSLMDGRAPGRDHFATISPDTDWRVCIDHCVRLGLGRKDYELTRI